MNRKVLTAGFLAAALTALPLSAVAANRALLVGVADYKYGAAPPAPRGRISNLATVKHDTELMKRTLIELGYKEKDIKVLTDRQASAEGIQRAIEQWLVQGVGPEESAIFYYSGHGTQIPDDNGDEPDGRDEALVTWDARPGTLHGLLRDDRLGQLLAHVRGRLYVFTDSCHSGTITRGIGGTSPGKQPQRPSKYQSKYTPWPLPAGVAAPTAATRSLGGMEDGGNLLLSACRPGEESLAGTSSSLFTMMLAQSVGRDHKVTLRSLQKEVAERLRTYIDNVNSGLGPYDHRLRVFEPMLSGDASLADTDLRVGYRSLAAGSSRAVRPRPADTAAATAVTGTDAALWQQVENAVAACPTPLKISSNKRSYHLGDLIELKVELPWPGYLNIINVGSLSSTNIVLFPNRYEEKNYVTHGGTFTLPGQGGQFIFRAQKPVENTLVAVVLSKKPLNLRQLSSRKELFSTLSPKAERAFRLISVEAAQEGGATAPAAAATPATQVFTPPAADEPQVLMGSIVIPLLP